ncbi:hypothetical protein BH10ACI2_BH10ACI2_23940 [soil metagenome]
MRVESNRYYGFGEFRIDARRHILLKNGEIISLTPRNFDLLLVLVENEGEILTHDDLLYKVWEGTFVEQSNLKNAVSVLRKVLGEDPGEGFYIRTIPRRGYSFVAPVQVIEGDFDSSQPSLSRSAVETAPVVAVEVANEKVHITDRDSPPEAQHVSVIPHVPRRNWPKFVAAILLLVLALVAAFFGTRRYLLTDKAIVYDATKVIISKITSDGNLVGGDASISPNGKYLVYAVREGPNVSLWTRQIVTGIARQISPVMQGSVWACDLTPDEDFIYYVFNSNIDKSKSGLFKISTFGGSAERVSDNEGGSISISPDGKRVAIVNTNSELETRIETIDVSGGDQRLAWSEKGDLRIWSIKFSPDGSSLLFSIRKLVDGKALYSIVEVPVSGGKEQIVLAPQDKQITDALWMPDKQSLLMSVRELNAELRQIWQYFPAGKEWKRVTNDNSSYRGISLTTDGKTLVASQESRLTSLWMSPSGAADDLKQVLPGNHYLIDVGWVSDSSLVYSIVENVKETIATINEDGTGTKSLTTGEDGIWVFPAPSRDGRHIAFASLRSGRRQIWAMDNDGKNPIQLSQFDTDVYDGRLLSDGKTCIFLQLETPQKSMVVLQKENGEIRPLVQNKTKRWALSPDEKFLAAEVRDPQSQKIGVVILNIESGEVVKRLDFSSGRVLRWTADGKALAYDINDVGSGRVMIQPIDGGPSKTLLTLKSEEIFSFDWTNDGKKFAIIRGNHLTDAVRISIGGN